MHQVTLLSRNVHQNLLDRGLGWVQCQFGCDVGEKRVPAFAGNQPLGLQTVASNFIDWGILVHCFDSTTVIYLLSVTFQILVQSINIMWNKKICQPYYSVTLKCSHFFITLIPLSFRIKYSVPCCKYIKFFCSFSWICLSQFYIAIKIYTQHLNDTSDEHK
jgi:hypothetical protein